MLTADDMLGVAVFAPKAGRGAAASAFTQVGKVRATVFAPGGRAVVGFLVKRPDALGMVRREDAFVALDALAPCDGGVLVAADRADAAFDEAARTRLGVAGEAWERCVVWAGMDAVTESGRELGWVANVEFDARTGAVSRFFVADGGVAQRLVGSVPVPAEMLRGYRDGKMVVTDAAATLALDGGLAARAGAAAGKAQVEGAKVAARAGQVAGRAVDTGSKALGRQLGKTRGMFGAFMDEYRRASK